MLYEVLSQPIVLLCMISAGMVGGILFDIKNILDWYFKKNKVLSHIFAFFATFGALFLCFYVNLICNYGEFRFFSIATFVLSLALERFIMTNFLAIPISKCYNKMKVWHGRKGKEKI